MTIEGIPHLKAVLHGMEKMIEAHNIGIQVSQEREMILYHQKQCELCESIRERCIIEISKYK